MPRAVPALVASFVASLILACAGAAQAQPVDPLQSPECSAAREALAQAQENAAARRAGARDALATARENARLACLGRESGNAQRVGAPDPPIAVPAPVIEPPPPPRALVTPISPPPPPLQIPRPAAITACDPGGCWDSNGQRLNQLGPMLVGPHGACTVQGGVVQCP
jgi:hypothetical protein